MAALYTVAAWLIMQVADVLIDLADLPARFGPMTLGLLALGLPIALILSWFYEITPQGISLEKDVDPANSIKHITGRRLDFLVISLLCAALVLFAYDKWWDQGLPQKSIAVLPFVNRSAIAEDIYFVDGIHDDILTQLSKVSGLEKVISRGSTERYRNTDKPMRQIGEELGVAAILEGGVQRFGDRVRINMQLIDASRDKHIWAETFDRELNAENLFAVQSEISREVVRGLRAALTAEDNEQLSRLPTKSLAAYREFVLGRQEMAKRTAGSLALAQRHFEKAIELDSEYALAYVGLADTLAVQVGTAGKSFQDTLEPRKAAIQRALQLDPRSGEAYAALALLRLREGSREEAESYFLKAIELSPNYAPAYHWYSVLLNATDDRREESLTNIRKALSLDPSAPVLVTRLSHQLRRLGRVEEAKVSLLNALKHDPAFPNYYSEMANILMRQGQIGKALAWANEAARLNPQNFYIRNSECYLVVNLGDPDAAQLCLDAMRKEFSNIPESTFAILAEAVFFLKGDARGATEYADSLSTSASDSRTLIIRGLIYLRAGEWRRAREALVASAPEFYTDGEITVGPMELDLAIAIAATLREGDGWSERAHYLAGQALITMESTHRMRGIGYHYLDVAAHMVRGDNAMAVSALREAIDSGWRMYWWGLRTPVFEMANLGPEWNALVAELEADIAEQKAWYEEHKDDALY